MNESITIKFIQTIEKYPCLYNYSLPEYSRKDITEKSWNEISHIMNWTVTECKEKWKNIRNGFVRSLKSLPSGSSTKAKKPYYLHDIMQFVLPYVRPIQHSERTGNFLLTEIVEETESNAGETEEQNENESNKSIIENQSEKSQILTRKRKRKFKNGIIDEVYKTFMDYLNQKKQETRIEDHQRMFLLSLLPDINKLSDNNLRQFKIKTMVLLQNLLEQQSKEEVVIFPMQIQEIYQENSPSTSSTSSTVNL